jgi:hypothetical protein
MRVKSRFNAEFALKATPWRYDPDIAARRFRPTDEG